MNKNLDVLTKQILFYVSQKSINRSLLLNGSWGSGKTYFIKNYLNSFLNDSGKTVIYVSLFGLDSIEQISKNIILKSETKIGKALSFLGSRLSLNLSFPFGSVNLSGKNKKKNELKFKDDQVLVIDDLERSKINLIELLGYFNNLNENCNIPILFVCDNTKLKITLDGKNEYLFPEEFDKRTFEHKKIKISEGVKEIKKYWDKCIFKILNFESYISKENRRHILCSMLEDGVLAIPKTKTKLVCEYFMYDVGNQGDINWRLIQNALVNFNAFLNHYQLDLENLSELFIEKTIIYFYFNEFYSDLTLENNYSYNHYAFSEVSIDLSVWNNIIKNVNGKWEMLDKDNVLFIVKKFKSFQNLTTKYPINDFIYYRNHSIKADLTFITHFYKDIKKIDATALVDVFWPFLYRLIEIKNKFQQVSDKFNILLMIRSLIDKMVEICSQEFFKSLPDIQQISPIHSRLMPLYSDENEDICNELEQIYQNIESSFYVYVKQKIVGKFDFNNVKKSSKLIELLLGYYQLIFQKFSGHNETDCKVKISLFEILGTSNPNDLFNKIIKLSPTEQNEFRIFLKKIKIDFYIKDFDNDFKNKLNENLLSYVNDLKKQFKTLDEQIICIENFESIILLIDEIKNEYLNSDSSNVIPSQKILPVKSIRK